jgi:hypothetical protein
LPEEQEYQSSEQRPLDPDQIVRRSRPGDQVAVIESGFEPSVGGLAPSSFELLLLQASGTSATATPSKIHNAKLEIRRM